MDLIGTASLPIAIALTYTLIGTYIKYPPKTFEEAIPLCLLVAVIGLPAVLILLATRKVVYVCWMLIYLIALPVWNFILPVYSFWHFDDFSWGETRKVEGEAKDKGHLAEGGTFVANSVPLRRWEDWERSRLRKLKREAKRRQEMERQFGKGFYNEDRDHSDQYLDPVGRGARTSFDSSDAASDFDDDRWGTQIGGYDESQPPPLAAVRQSMFVADGDSTLVGAHDLEEMMEKGWDENDKDSWGGEWRKDNSFSPYPPMSRMPPNYSTVGNGQNRQGPPPVPPVPQRNYAHPRRPGEENVALIQEYPDAPGGGPRGLSSGVNRGPSGDYPGQQHARNRSQPQNQYGGPPHMNNNRMDYR